MSQNVYDYPEFFDGYSRMLRSVEGLDGAAEWPALRALLPDLTGLRVLDLGCGTGQISLRLAEAGHTVTGVEPALASLDVARAKPGAERVTWIHGLAADAPSDVFDVALMTNHVAQFLAGNSEWQSALRNLHRALKPGGRLIFDTRDPASRAWETWSPDDQTTLTLPDGMTVLNWTEVTDVTGECVSFTQHYLFLGLEEEYLSHSTLRFRPEQSIRQSLQAAGFEIEAIYGGWQRESIGQGDGEFIVFARAK